SSRKLLRRIGRPGIYYDHLVSNGKRAERAGNISGFIVGDDRGGELQHLDRLLSLRRGALHDRERQTPSFLTLRSRLSSSLLSQEACSGATVRADRICSFQDQDSRADFY